MNVKKSAMLAIFIAIIAIGITVIILGGNAKNSNQKDIVTEKSSLSSEPYLMLRFDGYNYLITSNPVNTDSFINITRGLETLNGTCPTEWPVVQMVKSFSDGSVAHIYLVRTRQFCSAGIEIEKYEALSK